MKGTRNSPLPENPEYWATLAERIRDDAAEPLSAYELAGSWQGVLARRASWLVAAAAVLIVALLLTLPSSPEPNAYRLLERSLTPDEAAGSLIAGPSAPTVGTLLPEFAPASLEEVPR